MVSGGWEGPVCPALVILLSINIPSQGSQKHLGRLHSILMQTVPYDLTYHMITAAISHTLSSYNIPLAGMKLFTWETSYIFGFFSCVIAGENKEKNQFAKRNSFTKWPFRNTLPSFITIRNVYFGFWDT